MADRLAVSTNTCHSCKLEQSLAGIAGTDSQIAAPDVHHLHLKDKAGGDHEWNVPATGAGTVDFVAVSETLTRVGFAGPVSVELEFQGEPWPPLDDVEAALASSHRFIRQYLPEQELV